MVVQSVLDKRAAGRLCRCIEDTKSPEVTRTALFALYALGCSAAVAAPDSLPLPGDGTPSPPLAAWTLPPPHRLLGALQRDAAHALLNSPSTQTSLRASLVHPKDALCPRMLRFVAAACHAEPQVAQAALGVGLPEALPPLLDGSAGPDALAAFTALATALDTWGPQPALLHTLTAGGIDALLHVLLPLIKGGIMVRGHGAACAAAGALAAALGLAAPRQQQQQPLLSVGSPRQGPSPRRADAQLAVSEVYRGLVAAIPESVYVVLRGLLQSKPLQAQSASGGSSPGSEEWPGKAGCPLMPAGRMDGPVCLAAALARGGAGKVLGTGVCEAVGRLVCAVSGGGSPMAPLELSPPGLLAAVLVLQSCLQEEPAALQLLLQV